MKLIIMSLVVFMTMPSSFAQSNSKTKVNQEFMYFVYSNGNRVTDLSSDKQQLHIKKIGAYIENLAKTGKLKDAQPLEMEGTKIASKKGIFTETALNKDKKVIAGYYHILAADMDDAITIAKADPRFEEEGWEIVIRPIKKVEGINKK
ncbi:YciI family protein [Aquimarina agarilytica]|uniref:YciI family protein n=1 Tax=Aquimarina agarilytica TaxID=1087449 RepID=UPI000289FD34|nr:YciI family protein [Aquimarina agarilytica]